MWKILNVIAILIAGGAGYVAYLNRDALQQEKDLLSRAQGYREQTQEWYRKAGEEMKDREGKRDGLIAEREEAEKNLTDKEEELANTEQELATTMTQIEEKQTDLDAKKQVIAEHGGFKETFEKVEGLTESIASLTVSIAGMKQKNASDTVTFSGTVAKIKDYVNLELWQKTGKMKSLNASVAMVSPEFRFVIIDAGATRGVVSGAQLDVFRGGAKIADLRVAVLEPNRSVCNIETILVGESIQPGDQVVVSEESKPSDKDVVKTEGEAAPAQPGTPTPDAGAGMEKAPATGGTADEDPFGGFSTEGIDPSGAPDAEAPAAEDDAADPFGLGN